MQPKSPFFARYLESQLTDHETHHIQAGHRPQITLKWPSDNDEAALRRRLRLTILIIRDAYPDVPPLQTMAQVTK